MNNYNEALGHLILNKLNGVVKNGQSSYTGNIEYTRHRTKTNKIRDITPKTKTGGGGGGGELDIGGNV